MGFLRTSQPLNANDAAHEPGKVIGKFVDSTVRTMSAAAREVDQRLKLRYVTRNALRADGRLNSGRYAGRGLPVGSLARPDGQARGELEL